MFKKLFLALLIVGLVSSVAYSAATVSSATKSRAASLDKGLEQIVGVGDISSGDSVEVDGRGSMSVLVYPQQLTTSHGSALEAGVALVTGAARVSSITCGGIGTSAGDYTLIYDALTATGTILFECSVGTAKDVTNIVLPNGGAIFSTGVFADSNSDQCHVAVTYDQ